MKKSVLLYSLLALLTLVFGACSHDDDNYQWATASGAQVYFSNEMTSENIEVSKEAYTVNVPIYRVDTDGELTVSISSTCASDAYTIPSTVTFADGSNVAYITITYNPDALSYGEYDDITLTIDGAYTTEYGDAEYTGKIGVAEAWSEWTPYNSAGTCTYEYTSFLSGTDPGLKFYYRQNLIETNKYEFAVGYIEDENNDILWGYGVTLYLEYDSETGIVSVPSQYMGYTHSSYGEVNIIDYEGYYALRGWEFDGTYGTFDKELGIITIPVFYYVSAGYFGAGNEYIYLDGFPDISSNVVYAGKFINTEENPYIVANVTLGEDVEYAYVALVEGSEVSDDVLAEIQAGTYTPLQSVTESGEVRFDAVDYADGTYTIVVVPFYNKTAQAESTATFKYAFSSAAETWSAVYTGSYTYTAKSYRGYFFENEVEEDVTLYQSDSDENRYKLDPWGTTGSEGLIFTLNEDGTITCDQSFTGYVDDTYGEVYAIDLVSYGYDSYTSYYEDGTFYFNLAYYVSAGAFGYVMDTFTITGTAGAKAFTPAKSKSKRANVSGTLLKNHSLRTNKIPVRTTLHK